MNELPAFLILVSFLGAGFFAARYFFSWLNWNPILTDVLAGLFPIFLWIFFLAWLARDSQRKK